MTVRARLVAGFSVVLGLCILLGVASVLTLQSIKTRVLGITDDAFPGVTAAAVLRAAVGDVHMHILRHSLATTTEERKHWEDEITKMAGVIAKELEDYEKSIVREEDRAAFNKLQAARAQYIKLRAQALQLSNSGKNQEFMDFSRASLSPAYEAYQTGARELFEENADYGKSCAASIRAAITRGHALTVGISIGTFASGVVVAILSAVGLGRMLRVTAQALNEGAIQVEAASSQVAAASKTLADGASEQAASLEETSASLVEISSMTKSNAQSAERAKTLAAQTREAADQGSQGMEEMGKAMAEIKTASDNIGKIIKTIDEIAFQTNILALNAAVEAARAGDAGMGFAVVAEEVRSLSQRCAQAARETTDKIEDSIVKSNRGVQLSARVAANLQEIVNKAREVDQFVAEIASASAEQSEGIAQVNAAVGQMDQLTQSNAASAEESASAAVQLKAQAASLNESVDGLLALVDGAARGGGSRRNSKPIGVPKMSSKPSPEYRKHDASVNDRNGSHAFTLKPITAASGDRNGSHLHTADFHEH